MQKSLHQSDYSDTGMKAQKLGRDTINLRATVGGPDILKDNIQRNIFNHPFGIINLGLSPHNSSLKLTHTDTHCTTLQTIIVLKSEVKVTSPQ